MLWLWRFLTSRNTAIILLLVVSFILLIGAVLPNPSLMPPEDIAILEEKWPFLLRLGENFNSMKVGRSYAFGIIGIFLIISTATCSIDRVIKKIKTRPETITDLPQEMKTVTFTLQSMSANNTESMIVALLKKDRWKIRADDSANSRIISARKGDVGFWGSIFFHAILVTLIAGLVVYYLSGFYATMRITEGQKLMLTKGNLLSIEREPAIGMALPDIQFNFRRFSAEYYDDVTATDFTAEFDITDMKTGETWEQIFKINRPFHYKGIEFLMVMQGYSPHFILYKNDVPVFDAVVALDFDRDYRGSFDITGQGMRVVTQFFPDMARNKDGSVYTKTFRPKNPYFGLEVFQGSARVFRKLVGMGDSAPFGQYKLEFHELHHWITLHLVRETGIGFFFVCFMIGIIGIFARAIDPDRRIVASIQSTRDGQAVSFYYAGKHFEGIIREYVVDIMNKLKSSPEEA